MQLMQRSEDGKPAMQQPPQVLRQWDGQSSSLPCWSEEGQAAQAVEEQWLELQATQQWEGQVNAAARAREPLPHGANATAGGGVHSVAALLEQALQVLRQQPQQEAHFVDDQQHLQYRQWQQLRDQEVLPSQNTSGILWPDTTGAAASTILTPNT